MGLIPVGSADAVLEARDLYRFFHAGDEETLALRGVSMALHEGEVLAVTGPSGSGKSTLLACLAGLDEPDGGAVLIEGVRISRRSEAKRAAIRGRRVGVLYQQTNLLGHLTVAENVAIARKLGGRRGGGRREAEVLERLGISDRAGHLPEELSGGELARAGLAVALANDPPVILADEPTGELDLTTADAVIGLLREHAAAGAAVVVLTHSRELAAVADSELALRDGEVVV